MENFRQRCERPASTESFRLAFAAAPLVAAALSTTPAAARRLVFRDGGCEPVNPNQHLGTP